MVNRVTGVTNTRYAVPSAEGRYRLRQGGTDHPFSQSEFFCEKDKVSTMLPQARLLSSDQTSSLNVHYVNRVINTSYAVIYRKIYFVSDRAEPTILFHEHLAL
jgi:hypothetical protein